MQDAVDQNLGRRPWTDDSSLQAQLDAAAREKRQLIDETIETINRVLATPLSPADKQDLAWFLWVL